MSVGGNLCISDGAKYDISVAKMQGRHQTAQLPEVKFNIFKMQISF